MALQAKTKQQNKKQTRADKTQMVKAARKPPKH